MQREIVQRAYEVALLAAKHGEPARFNAAMTKLQTLDRANEIPLAEILLLKIFGHARCGELKNAAEAVRTSGGQQSPPAQRARQMLLDMPEASIARYRECIDGLIPPAAVAVAKAHAPIGRWALVAVAVCLLLSAGVAIWAIATRERTMDDHDGSGGFAPATSAPAIWQSSLPPEIALGTSPAAREYRRMSEAIGKVIVRATVLLDSGRKVTIPIASGSGFVVTPDGLIVTNKHVVDAVKELQERHSDIVGWDVVVLFATLGDQPMILPGRVGRISAYVDLATIQVDHKFDSVMDFAQTPTPGEPVRAYGFPGVAEDVTEELNASDLKERAQRTADKLRAGEEPNLLEWFGSKNLQLVVTSGVVSAVRETEKGMMIQTDTSVTHGNSGGPLVDSQGHVVGIVTLGAEGTNFCIAGRTVFQELAREPGIKWPKSFSENR